MRREFDPVSAWLAEIGWCKGESHWIVMKNAITDYDKFRRVHHYQEMTSRTLRRRLEGLGYRTDDSNHSIGLRFYYSKTADLEKQPEEPTPDEPGHYEEFANALGDMDDLYEKDVVPF